MNTVVDMRERREGSNPDAERLPVAFSETAERRLRAARLWITLNRPYYSRALFGCILIPTQQISTMCIDRRWRVYVNSAFVERLTVEQTAAVLIHELNHLLRDHSTRAAKLDVHQGEHTVWNIAADCEINDDLVEDCLELPEGYMVADRFSLEIGRTAEHYFQALRKNATLVEVSLQCGSGCTGHGDESQEGSGEHPDLAEGLSPVEQDMLRRIVANAVAEHEKSKGIGSVPQGLSRWADQTLKPKVDWRRALESAVRRGVHLRAGAADYTWQRPSRRYDSDESIIRPGMTRPVPDVAVVVDTSGSMDDGAIARAMAEIRGIITRVVPSEGVQVYSVDCDVVELGRVFSTRQVNLVGGGGTDMRVGIEAAAKRRPAVIVVITDGYTPWPDAPPPGVAVMIAALTEARAIFRVPPWFKTVDLSDELTDD